MYDAEFELRFHSVSDVSSSWIQIKPNNRILWLSKPSVMSRIIRKSTIDTLLTVHTFTFERDWVRNE